ncbi:MAG: HAD family hydrolase, partial [Gammaproteobacteria bacterium]|nr:HAD family hydrolase [Gammaproteobacteria bacterium]
MTLKALLFDVDGTLADTERDGHRLAFNRAFAAAGLDWRWDVALYGELLAITGGKERMRHYVERYRPDYRKPPGFDDLVARLHAAKTAHYTALLAQGDIPLR